MLGVVPHHAYAELDGVGIAGLLRPGGLLADLKGVWRDLSLPEGIRRWVPRARPPRAGIRALIRYGCRPAAAVWTASGRVRFITAVQNASRARNRSAVSFGLIASSTSA